MGQMTPVRLSSVKDPSQPYITDVQLHLYLPTKQKSRNTDTTVFQRIF